MATPIKAGLKLAWRWQPCLSLQEHWDYRYIPGCNAPVWVLLLLLLFLKFCVNLFVYVHIMQGIGRHVCASPRMCVDVRGQFSGINFLHRGGTRD